MGGVVQVRGVEIVVRAMCLKAVRPFRVNAGGASSSWRASVTSRSCASGWE